MRLKVAKEAKADQQLWKTFEITPESLRKRLFDPKDPMCPFYNYVGNDEAKKVAISLGKRAFNSYCDIGLAVGAWHEPIWACNRLYPVRMLLKGPRSVGKTTFGKAFAGLMSIDWNNCPQAVGPESPHWKLPWAEVDGTGVTKREQILQAITAACEAKEIPLIPVRVTGGVRYFRAPPMVLFVDEVHGLPSALMEGLLKMTEPNDGVLEVGPQTKVDCRSMTIITATTNPGKLKDTFLSRFPVALELKQHTPDQVAEMIIRGFKWPKKEALELAMLKPLPREAMSVAKLVQDTVRDERISLPKALQQWKDDLSLREGGLDDKAVEVLAALAESMPHGLSQANLCASLAIEKEEFTKQIVPQLLRSHFHPAYMVVAGRHKVTDAGLAELKRRGRA